jgi:hypothetical protein
MHAFGESRCGIEAGEETAGAEELRTTRNKGDDPSIGTRISNHLPMEVR